MNTPLDDKKERILLLMLPFWIPMIPPMGVASLKGYLEPHGFDVKTIDANTENRFRDIYQHYFNALKMYIPESLQGNLVNLGNYLLEKHMMAYLNRTDETRYRELFNIILEESFLCRFEDKQIEALNALIDKYFKRLDQYIQELMEQEQPDLLGLSVFGGNLPAVMRLVKTSKEKFPHMKIILGGGVFVEQLAEGSKDMDNFLNAVGQYIDHIIIGEGENLFLEYLKGNLPESEKIYTLANQQVTEMNLDQKHIPNYSEFDIGYYSYLGASGSRSCPYKCKFCNERTTWGKYRKKESRQVVEEMSRMYQVNNYQLFFFSDSLLNPIITPLSKEMIDAGESLYWDGFFRADRHACDMENTFRWRRAGFYRARLGLESGSINILEKMGKEIDLDTIRQSVHSLAAAGIKTTTYWVIGYPGETEQDFQMTLDLVEEMKDNIYEAETNPFTLFPNSRIATDPELNQGKKIPAYPSWADSMLICQYHNLDIEPSRREVIDRMQRFEVHCKKLGIPNPYSLQEVHLADDRWQKLHQNAVPPLVAFKDRKQKVIENLEIEQPTLATESIPDDDDWL